MVWSVEALPCPFSKNAGLSPPRGLRGWDLRHYWEPRLRITVLIVSKMIKKSKESDMCLI